MPTAILFPGQASQTPDMRDAVAALRPDLLPLVAEIVGEDPFPRVDEDTRFAQPALFCASLAGWEQLRDSMAEPPAAFAGHSLGEFAAVAAAGVIDEADALRLVALRGRLMSQCRQGTMLAALGGDADDVEAIALRRGVAVANDNAPGQLVLSGERLAIGLATVDLRALGIRTLELNVNGAFHSPLMAAAVPPFAKALAAVEVHGATAPVWSCLTARPLDDVRTRLRQGLTWPVRWRETVLALHRSGVEHFEEAGPGRVLTKMLNRTLPEAARA